VGYAVVIVNDGAQAVIACVQHEFALVLMDLQMTPMDGFEATREIRRQEQEGQRSVPIFGLSATAGGEALAHCTAAGMNGLLIKPLQRSRLSQALEQLSAASADPVPPEAQVNDCTPAAGALPADLPALRGRFQGDTAFVLRLCQTFLASARRLVNELERAAGAGDRAQLRALAHKVKGASDNVHAHAAATLAARIETESSSMTLAQLSRAIDALRRAVEDVATQVSAELA
jgi:CheY-like chemotaxis protein/HPt (histidine-containing phosphotransfer) domain-containing protein